ncbi:NADH-FMN oxidoreductase RutF, flavin reductase (DIM6/NTAB) family [Chryseolinea serpens]|uniref:NADH-FMN oxidoreductase RutF, flavin reductase (DIM6/NTAB) family n=1 Tax=Chryseolinea serpens TaxID=947013 RepID=A0A1M5NN12_9BACT|nr:flavin reductase family protein [Chryseolinea serpens]SHG90900.1 NADH-FMN oxidoreductase RutF, flavin reductase (DIM6/NTAB) family [Chryseolinea serpens]
MKSFLKSIAKRALFGDRVAKNFPPIRIAIGKMEEKVFLSWHDDRLDISERHCIVCHAPFCLTVWLTAAESIRVQTNILMISVATGQKIHAEITASVIKKIETENGFLFVVRAEKASCYQKNALFQLFMRRYFRHKNTPQEDKFYAAAYSYPRRVIAVSFQEASYYNIFPMDFQCSIAGTDLYVLGLRTTNVTLDKIIQSKRVVIGDTARADLDVIYALGRNHSASPPPQDSLAFEVLKSERFGFPVPVFSASYKEIDLIAHHNLGTHTMLIGRIANAKLLWAAESYLYHIHFLQSFRIRHNAAQ